MKAVIFIFVSVILVGCNTGRHKAPTKVLAEADLLLSRAEAAADFERRLDELGAKIEAGANPGERVATFPLPPKPGYFPPRTVKVVYEIGKRGSVDLKATEIVGLGTVTK